MNKPSELLSSKNKYQIKDFITMEKELFFVDEKNLYLWKINTQEEIK